MFLLMQNIFIVPAMQHGCRAKSLLEVKKTNRMANSGADINRHYSANNLLSLPRQIPHGELSQSPKHMVIEPFLFVRRNFGTPFLWRYVEPVHFYHLGKNLRPFFLLHLLRVTHYIFNSYFLILF